MIEINNTTLAKINCRPLKLAAEKFLLSYRFKNKTVSIAFVSDLEMRRLNRTYRGMNKTTDVLSFEGEGDFLGEIILSYQQIKKQAKENKNSVSYELLFITIHGLLHLAGYDDDTEKKRLKMIALGEDFLKKNQN